MTIVPPPAALQMRIGGLHHQQRAGEVDGEDSVPIGGRHGLDVGERSMPAALTTPSSPPSAAADALTAAATAARSATSTATACPSASPRRVRAAPQGPAHRGRARRRARLPPRSRTTRREANALGGASHQDAPSLEAAPSWLGRRPSLLERRAACRRPSRRSGRSRHSDASAHVRSALPAPSAATAGR